MYDTIIIGCGPAGITAAIYLLREDKKVLILEKEGIGGAIASSPIVENYPGYKSISGSELTSNMFDQADSLGVDLEMETVIRIENDGSVKKVITEDNTYETKTIIIASGSKYRTLGLPNESSLIGNGLHFCVACDGPFYNGKTVAVVGGGDSACVNALSLAKFAKKVYLIIHKDHLTGEYALQKEIKKVYNIEVIYNSSVVEYLGTNHLTGIIINKNNEKENITLDGLFLSIGLIPQNEFAKDILNIDERGYIVSSDCKTNVLGIYVAGDSRTKDYRQVTLAVGDGTNAALLAINYLNS